MNLWLLAAETAEAEAEGGFLEFIAEKNLLNFAIIAGLLFYLGRGILTKLLNDRRQAVENEITEVETRRKQAEAALVEQKKNLAQAESEAVSIRNNALTNAKRVRTQILEQVDREILQMRQDSQRELDSDRARVVAQLRRLTLERTFQKVETDLPAMLNDEAQGRLIDQGLSLLEGRLDRAGQ
ncbi:F0F1 ATP synthase subunit B [Candidatus Cyanaurora vandensis]|uniref:F0F1 ATP synthase subunit B n=1 Tax=Candidatus Cyanaurora vandensis TaxID=2714958 RepID=UPI00258021E5|nr:F0F1 ATP synthase subunit B [Candidatus Cyanaurora vandensis]